MKLGEEAVEETKAMFSIRSSLILLILTSTLSYVYVPLQALESKISLSLDAWTSTNCYAFLAIVAHYITNNGQCGEFSIHIHVHIAHIFSRRATY